MCHNYTKHFFTSVLLLSTISPVFAQLTNNNSRSNNENSPYSRYGIGEQRNGVNTLLRQMGSISSAYANPFAVNTDNPASYSAIRLTTYEAGGEGSIRSTTVGSDKYSTGMATLSYLNVGLPVGKNGGLAFGLKPYTRTRYYLTSERPIPGLGNVTENYLGDGAINYGFIGGGYRYGGFSLGANFGYLFGTIEQSNSIIGDSVNTYATAIQRSDKIGGIFWKGGAQYQHKLKEKLTLRLGATAALSQNVNISRNEDWISYVANASGTLTIQDTAYSSRNTEGKITLPLSYSFGAHLLNESKWMIGADITATKWSQFRKFGNTDSLADQTFRVAVGGEYTPDATDTRNYFQRVTYRLGFYYGMDHVRLRSTDLNYYAVTGGLSLPFKRATDRIHLSLEAGSRGTSANGLIKETFVRFGVGITLNDKWFVKRKYE